MTTIPNTEFSAPDGCTIQCRGVFVRVIASSGGVYIEAYREEDAIALLDEFIEYPTAENE